MKRILLAITFLLMMSLPSVAETIFTPFEELPGIDVFGRAFEEGIEITVKDGWFAVNGEPVILKGINYTWARPGEIPARTRVNSVTLEKDIKRIKEAGFNCVRIIEADSGELETFRQAGLIVLQEIDLDPRGRSWTDPKFIEECQGRIRRVASVSKNYSNVLGYLLTATEASSRLNPSNLQSFETFFKDRSADIKEIHPDARVSFGNSASSVSFIDNSFCEFLSMEASSTSLSINDEATLRSVYQNLHDGISGGKRPYLITSTGTSACQAEMFPGQGAMDETKQANISVQMIDESIGSGACGTFYASWCDQWWMVDPYWEQNADRPQEWMGMIAFDSALPPDKYVERPRSVYQSVSDYNWAIVIEPHDQSTYADSVPVPVEVYCEPNVDHVSVIVDGGAEITLERKSLHWWGTNLSLSAGEHRAKIVACDASGFCRAPADRRFIVTKP